VVGLNITSGVHHYPFSPEFLMVIFSLKKFGPLAFELLGVIVPRYSCVSAQPSIPRVPAKNSLNFWLLNYTLQGEHLLIEVFMKSPRKIYPFSVYNGGC